MRLAIKKPGPHRKNRVRRVGDTDAYRVAYTAIHTDVTAESTVEFILFSVALYNRYGVWGKRVLTDNVYRYIANKFRKVCRELVIQHKRTKTYHPQTNGKAELFIRTVLKEWAYVCAYTHSWR